MLSGHHSNNFCLRTAGCSFSKRVTVMFIRRMRCCGLLIFKVQRFQQSWHLSFIWVSDIYTPGWKQSVRCCGGGGALWRQHHPNHYRHHLRLKSLQPLQKGFQVETLIYLFWMAVSTLWGHFFPHDRLWFHCRLTLQLQAPSFFIWNKIYLCFSVFPKRDTLIFVDIPAGFFFNQKLLISTKWVCIWTVDFFFFVHRLNFCNNNFFCKMC